MAQRYDLQQSVARLGSQVQEQRVENRGRAGRRGVCPSGSSFCISIGGNSSSAHAPLLITACIFLGCNQKIHAGKEPPFHTCRVLKQEEALLNSHGLGGKQHWRRKGILKLKAWGLTRAWKIKRNNVRELIQQNELSCKSSHGSRHWE